MITDLGTYDNLPDNLRHKINIKITTATSTLLDYTAFTSDLADREKVLAYAPATQADRDLLASYPSIYDVVPLSLLHLKPVFKVRGIIIAGGQDADPDVVAGKTLTLEMKFLKPVRDLSGALSDSTADTIAKPTIAGNAEAIAVNTGKIVAPEAFPATDTSSSEFLPTQKLYRTALNFLDRLEQSHDELSSITGIRFTNVATRAIVFNGINVEYTGPDPYRFTWKGLRIDASSVVAPYNHFGVDINKGITKFTYVFGLSASLDESAVFEEDFPGVEAISTVKGLRMINQGLIPGITMVKITSANVSVIDTLSVSQETKNRYYDAIAKGNTVYTPTAPFTYANWTGLLSITLDPQGFGSYLIGEGLNGGYTVEEFPDGWRNLFIKFTPGLTAIIVSPKNGDTFLVGQPFPWIADYKSSSIPFISWREEANLEGILPEGTPSGPVTICSGYGTGASVVIGIKAPPTLGKQVITDIDALIIQAANAVKTDTFTLPPDLFKAVLQQESGLKYKSYRYEPCFDRRRISGLNRPGANTNILSEQPYKHYRLKTDNPDLNPQLPDGDQVNSIIVNGEKVTVKDFYTTYSTSPLVIEDTNKDGKITAYEVWKLNDAKQNYSGEKNDQCVMTPEDGNFTPQFLISASYGLGQVMYPTAVADVPRDGTDPAENIGKLIEPTLTKSAQKLKASYESAVGTDGLCEEGGRWWNALLTYNGGGNPNYPVDICDWYNKGLYKVIP